MLEAKAKDQGHKCKCSPKKKGLHQNLLGDLQKNKKKRSSQKFFRRSPQKNVFQKIFQVLHKILTIQKILLSSSREQANFRGQGRLRGLHLWYHRVYIDNLHRLAQVR